MHILVLNCGSSSIKGAILNHSTGEHLVDLKVSRLMEPEATMALSGDAESTCGGGSHADVLTAVLPKMLAKLPAGISISAVGHRVVHGGDKFTRPTLVTEDVKKAIDALSVLAPLHNPANLAGIEAAQAVLHDVPHVAVFDTAFHATLPRRAQAYALPRDVVEKHGLRRYGFHGVSHGFVASKAAQFLETDIRDLRLITCHMGNGSSVAAVEYGRSVETSMGLTPLEGLVMGTRVGDIDPGVLLALMRGENLDVDGLDELLNRRSGLAGLSGVGNDMRDIELRAAEGDEQCRSAIQVFTHRVRKYIGAYTAVMGGVDAVVFTGGIGENSVTVRHRIAQRLDFLGARLDEDNNRTADVDRQSNPVADISTRNSRCKLLVVATDESLSIARDAVKVVLKLSKIQGASKGIPVAVSARHLHLTQETVEALFGEGYQLTERNPLSQPKQFACHETVDLVGPKRTIERVRILGPTRSKNQIEISRTDEFTLGIDAPVRGSGDVKNTPGVTLLGTDGRKVELKQGVICAWRHIHMTPDDATHFGVQDRDIVEVKLNSDGRDLVFGDVLIRVSPKYKLEMHIDTDEGNAANLSRGATATLYTSAGTASLSGRRTRYDNVVDRG